MTVPMKIFVSYSRSVKTDVGKVIDLLRAIGHEVWWDGDILPITDWWATILDNIEWCEVFIFVVSEKSVQSAYCLAELKYATERNRPILPFVMDDHTKYAIPPAVTPMRAQWYVYNGDPADMINRIKAGIDAIHWDKHRDIYAKRPPEPNTNTTSVIKQFQNAQKLAYAGKFDEAKIAFRNVSSNDFHEWGQECQEWIERINRYAEIYELANDKSTVRRAVEKWNDFIRFYGTDFDPFDLVNNPPVYTPPPKPSEKPLKNDFIPRMSATGARQSRSMLVLGGMVFAVIVLIVIAVSILNNQSNTPLVAENSTPTDTDSPTNTAIPAPTSTPQIGFTPITQNAHWIPIERDFDGVTMVLVPAGCFMMGSDTGEDDEKPVHEQCFETPFWIDKYEVTQAQFTQFGGAKFYSNTFLGDNRPVENITWFEARDYCQNQRGGRLPTEPEWEYAARGPDNLIYPWGNNFVVGNVVYSGSSNNQTVNVGRRPNGVSWVGAMDMSGNVWEWVSSLYGGYPYNTTSENIINNVNFRVLRGGSWGSSDMYIVRVSFRFSNIPINKYSDAGFRCSRFYSP